MRHKQLIKEAVRSTDPENNCNYNPGYFLVLRENLALDWCYVNQDMGWNACSHRSEKEAIARIKNVDKIPTNLVDITASI